MKNKTTIARNIDAISALEALFNFKGFYFAVHRRKVLVADHPAKINYVCNRRIEQIPMSYNGWLVWKRITLPVLNELVEEDRNRMDEE